MTRTITLTGVDGSEWDLTGTGVARAGVGPQLWGIVPSAITEQVAALLPGGRITAVRHAARDLLIPIVFEADTANDIEETIAALAKAVDPLQGDVTITVTRDDDTERWIVGRYQAGLEMVALDWQDANWAKAKLAIRAYDPYWLSDEADVTVVPPPPVFSSGTTDTDAADVGVDDPIPVDGFVTGTSWNDPTVGWNSTLPWSGEAGGVVVLTVDNQGDVDAWPIFTITGAATAVSASNITSGNVWALDTTLATDSVLVVDTTPGARQVTIDGHNAYGQLQDGASLWAFRPGESTIALRFDGTDGSSEFRFSWSPRWLTC